MSTCYRLKPEFTLLRLREHSSEQVGRDALITSLSVKPQSYVTNFILHAHGFNIFEGEVDAALGLALDRWPSRFDKAVELYASATPPCEAVVTVVYHTPSSHHAEEPRGPKRAPAPATMSASASVPAPAPVPASVSARMHTTTIVTARVHESRPCTWVTLAVPRDFDFGVVPVGLTPEQYAEILHRGAEAIDSSRRTLAARSSDPPEGNIFRYRELALARGERA